MKRAFKLILALMIWPALMLVSGCNPPGEEGEGIVLTSVSPTSGSMNGGTTFTILGNGLAHVEKVYLGGSLCTNLVTYSSEKISCTTPAHAIGTVDLVVEGAARKSDTLINAYTYQVAPVISSVSPSTGPSIGGTAVTINGSGFLSGAKIYFGGALCSNTVFVSSTQLTCDTPARSEGVAQVTVVNPDNQVVSSSAYTYNLAPSIASITPSGGAVAGGQTVTVVGSGFDPGITLTLGGTSCGSLTYLSNTKFTCVTGAHAVGVVNSVVTNTTDGQTETRNNMYSYQNPPDVVSVSPTGGSINGGTVITITGTGFFTGGVVTVGGSTCTGAGYISDTIFMCTTSSHAAGASDIVMTNADGQSDTLSSSYTYRPAPTVTSVSPSEGPISGSTAVTITGTNFVTGATVKLGGITCSSPTVVNATTITCTTGVTATAGPVSANVTNSDNQLGSKAAAFTYNGPPTITDVAPSVGPIAGGTAITITGTEFRSGASVTVGGNPCTSVNVASTTSITCTTPAGASGAANVTVTNSDMQSGSATGGFTFQTPAALSWNPGTDFSYGTSGTDVSQTFTLENTGGETATGIGIVIGGADPSAFAFGTNNCGSTLIGGQTCTIQVDFLGASGGLAGATTFTATLDVTSTTGGSDSNNMDGTTP